MRLLPDFKLVFGSACGIFALRIAFVACAAITGISIANTHVGSKALPSTLSDPNSPVFRKLIFFNHGVALVSDEFNLLLKSHAEFLIANPNLRVSIQGHATVFEGSREQSLALGQRRAEAIRSALINLGVANSQLEAISFGKEMIARPQDSVAGVDINRRTELVYVSAGYETTQSPPSLSATLPEQTTQRNQAKSPPQNLDSGKSDRERLTNEVEAERKKRQELEERLAAESKERERLTLEAKDRERLLAEAKEREQRSQSPPVQVASPKNPHALIIGNAAYPGSSRLDNPINDARAIEQKLKSMGFTVTVVNDANRQRLVQAMSQFRKTASNADLSLLFYSGHGVQIFGTNYILPIDVDQTDVAQATIQGVSLNSVVESFLPGKTKIVFLDACRDNPLQRSNDRSVSKGLAPISVAQGTLIAYATKDGQTASDGVGQKNSPFTKALLEHLSDPQDIAVILRKVREKVMTATGGKQQPWEYGSLTGGELVLSGVRR